MTEVLIPARQGRAVRVARGAAIDVINTHGTQVVDFWALCSPNTSEHLSMEHTRIAIAHRSSRFSNRSMYRPNASVGGPILLSPQNM